VTEADFRCGATSILALQYANSAEISRINKGLKRRKNQTVVGFNIDPRSGYWAKSEDEEPDVDVPPDVVRPVRIVPIVRDRKNALLLRFLDPDAYAPETIATVQHALLRGIAVTYQLEEGEILGEPLPARDNRRSILAYEATEGGAGVLNRLVEDAHALGKVAREALSLMHFDKVDDAIAAGDASLLVDRDSGACVRGCYRCLQMLIDLARGEIVLAAGSSRPASGIDGWDVAFKTAGIPAPDGASVSFANQEMSFAWRTHFIAACTGTLSAAAQEIADTKGWTVFELPETCADGVPDALISMFKD
jgi:hypothetical protein